ncbi:MAG TPA: hypothetical protein VFQ13_12745 [Anaerolineales bacterium]|nr:hypothetical protein [Anaerolineales bacterium]
MNIYSIVLFLHIVGALGVFVALGLEWTGLRQLRGAILPEQVRAWTGILKSTNKVGFPSMLTTVITGIYMVLNGLGWVSWILVVLGALVLIIVLSVALTKPRMAAIEQALATEKGSVSQTFHNLVNHPVLWISIQTRVAIALGIIFLKIAKPDFVGSLLTIGVAIVLGIASALPMSRPAPAHEAPTN